MAALHTQAFEDAIAVRPVTSHTYSVNLSSCWAIGDGECERNYFQSSFPTKYYVVVPHGGYLTAILYRLTTVHFKISHPTRHGHNASPVCMQVAFIRRSGVGPAQLDVEDIKLGSRTSIIRVKLSQLDEAERRVLKLVATVTISDLKSETGFSARTGWKLRPPQPTDEPPRTSSLDRVAAVPWELVMIPYPTFRKATTHVEVYGLNINSELSRNRGVTDQWSRLRWSDGSKVISGKWTNEAAAFLLDIFPQLLANLETIFGRGNPLWFATLTVNIEFKKDVSAWGKDWLYSRVNTKCIQNGRIDVEVILQDELGDIVALATHTCLIMSSARNHKEGNQSIQSAVLETLRPVSNISATGKL